jgi:Uma2 family endonuclease
MTDPAPADSGTTRRQSAERYLALVGEGVLGADDRVELLEGVIVAMSPHSPRHAAAIRRVSRVLREAISDRAVVSPQLSLIAGPYDVPEPDVAVLPGRESDYENVHPSKALLVVEVADTSLAQDRLTKAAIYAAAAIPEYWIVNLRDDCLEVLRDPAREARRYQSTRVVGRDQAVAPVALPGVVIAVSDLLSGRRV